MHNYGKVKSSIKPKDLEITDSKVFVASDITPYTETIDEHEVNGYEYNYISYDKDEYIQNITKTNADNIDMLLGCVLEMSEIVYQ